MTQSASNVLDMPVQIDAGLVRIEYVYNGKAFSFDFDLSRDTHRERINTMLSWATRKEVCLTITGNVQELIQIIR